MNEKLQRRIQRYGWDKAVSYYEPSWAEQLAPAQERLLALAELKLGERVLDVACGTGLVTFPVAEAVGDSGAVLATDISEGMVVEARKMAADRGVHNIEFERMDAENLSSPDGEFDAVVCGLGLMYVPDPQTALRQFHRVLRSGGRTVSAVWGRRDQCGWAGIFPTVDARVESEVCPLFFQLGTGDHLRWEMEAAGFEDIRVERINTVLKYPTDEAALEAAFAGGPVALAYARFDERTRDEAHAEYLESIAPFRNGNGYKIPGEFVIAAGRK